VAKEIDAPRLLVVRPEAQGVGRDGHLGGPTVVGDARRRIPDAVPVAVDVRGGAAAAAFAFVEDLLLELGAERRGHEHVAVARILESVEDDLEVVFVEQAVGVAPHLGRHDSVAVMGMRAGLGPGRRRRSGDPAGLVGVDGDVDGAGVVDDAHFGALGGRLTEVRLLLGEPLDRRRPGPDLVVEGAVDARALVNPNGVDGRTFATGLSRGWHGGQTKNQGKRERRERATTGTVGRWHGRSPSVAACRPNSRNRL
jgi:hypothetical protein